MRRLFSEPLIQFMVLGLVLFVAVELVAPDQLYSNDRKQIIVDDTALTQYMQFQAKSFTPDNAEQKFASLAPAEQNRLAQDYVRDQVLYREALALGLEKNDEIIRRRLIQKMEFIAKGFVEDAKPPSESDLNAFFAANRSDYIDEAAISFTHIYLPHHKESATKAAAEAETLLPRLNKNKTTANEASEYGKRFHFNRSYQVRTKTLISSHFGESFAKAAFSLKPADHWQGPIISQYGAHLLWVNASMPSRLPELSEVAPIVLQDYRRYQQGESKRLAYEKLRQTYKVTWNRGEN
ncbi:hypothetical protein PsAD2_02606 [Pseudovibrio axinellae]|uniref:Parvulin-like PPIase n=1 Tax=Pseudovibrio axinellae TaxID=989403 RepID=A0A165Y2V5_9HYPH|nr:peptidylprolyl isomerase [Pseudovibrio axinellae]KZL18382.1 hypothetical protein PsAD2_02606 [Pseudovibrio axinellae]SER70886.1 PPIC-type PPIASE domain-containing protein [Pseudovibrio axinellae]